MEICKIPHILDSFALFWPAPCPWLHPQTTTQLHNPPCCCSFVAGQFSQQSSNHQLLVFPGHSSLCSRSRAQVSPTSFFYLNTTHWSITPSPPLVEINPFTFPYHPASHLWCSAAWFRHRRVSWPCICITSFISSLRNRRFPAPLPDWPQ